MTTILNENFKRNLDIMRKNIHRGLTEAQANQVIDSQEAQFKKHSQWTVESREYINQMRQVVADGFGGSISAADAMAQMGVHVVRIK